MAELSQVLEGLTDQQGEILKTMEDLTAKVETGDDEAKAQLKTLGDQMAEIDKERRAAQAQKDAADAKAMVEEWKRSVTHSQSKAANIGFGGAAVVTGSNPQNFGFFTALAAAKSIRFPEDNAPGKAYLDSIGYDLDGSWHAPTGKATLGDSAAA